MELKHVPHQIKAGTVDRENFTIDFVLSSGAVDRHGEVIDQAGWKLENYLKNPVVLWGHDQKQFPIGRCENIAVKDGKLQATVRFAYTQNPQAAIAFELCADEFLNAGSVGFMNMKWMYDENNDLLTLLENELYEFSIVNVPANPDALSKAADRFKAKGLDRRVIEGVEDLRKELEQKNAARFEGLGDEVKAYDPTTGYDQEKDEAAAAAITEEAPAAPAAEAEPTDEEVKGAATALLKTDKMEVDAVMKALEVLVKAPTTKIQAAVQELISDESKDADTKGTVETTPAPLGRKVRKYDVNEINRVIRSLAKAGK